MDSKRVLIARVCDYWEGFGATWTRVMADVAVALKIEKYMPGISKIHGSTKYDWFFIQSNEQIYWPESHFISVLLGGFTHEDLQTLFDTFTLRKLSGMDPDLVQALSYVSDAQKFLKLAERGLVNKNNIQAGASLQEAIIRCTDAIKFVKRVDSSDGD